MSAINARALAGLPEITPGTDLAGEILAAAERQSHMLSDHDVVVVAQKAVSKAEGRIVSLANVTPGERARSLADQHGQDPRAVQVVLDESTELVRAQRGVLICRTRHGYVCANAGVDASNTAEPETLILLPVDPDGSARALRAELAQRSGARPAVLITDSFGRAWRHGQCDVTIGAAGLAVLEDWRGRTDGSGRALRATWIAVADQVAAAADLVRAKDSHEPVVVVSGLARHVSRDDGPGAAALVRPLAEDMFR